jgi:DNA repair protein RecN (Recombination protein N)
MQPVTEFDPVLNNIFENFQSVVYQIDDIGVEIRRYIEGLDVDEAEMYEVENRMNAVNALKIKHGKTIRDILYKRDDLEKQLIQKQNKLEQFNQLEQSLINEKKAYLERSQQLHESRKALVPDFETHVMKEMALLNMKEGLFKVQFEDNNLEVGAYRLSKNGFDQVSFLISTNPGMPLSPLSKVASGGEISRMMLSIKMALAHHDEVHTLVFDEVDTGISGATALVVGEKMHQLTKDYQVLLITHLPQIAIMADRHYLIDKIIESQKTETMVRTLNPSERLKEIARMLSGDENSQISIKNAEEMMENAQKLKSLS